MLFFDSESKYAAIILNGAVLRGPPTVIYVPYHYHYSPEFRVWATSKEVEWDKENQLLYWYPATDQDVNQIIIGTTPNLDTKSLPKRVKTLLDKTELVNTFS